MTGLEWTLIMAQRSGRRVLSMTELYHGDPPCAFAACKAGAEAVTGMAQKPHKNCKKLENDNHVRPSYREPSGSSSCLYPAGPRLKTPKLLDFTPAIASVVATVSPSLKSSRTAAARVGIRYLKRKSSSVSSSSGESMTCRRSPRMSFMGTTQNVPVE